MTSVCRLFDLIFFCVHFIWFDEIPRWAMFHLVYRLNLQPIFRFHTFIDLIGNVERYSVTAYQNIKHTGTGMPRPSSSAATARNSSNKNKNQIHCGWIIIYNVFDIVEYFLFYTRLSENGNSSTAGGCFPFIIIFSNQIRKFLLLVYRYLRKNPPSPWKFDFFLTLTTTTARTTWMKAKKCKPNEKRKKITMKRKMSWCF